MWKVLSVVALVVALAATTLLEPDFTDRLTAAVKHQVGGVLGMNRPKGPRIYTAAELKTYDGSDESKPLLLCVLGEVFDVSAGARFYKKGEGYNVFLGQDASRAFHDGKFDRAVEDVRDLDVMAIGDVVGWRTFFQQHKEYKFVGFLHGLYHDANGAPTNALHEVEVKHQQGLLIKK